MRLRHILTLATAPLVAAFVPTNRALRVVPALAMAQETDSSRAGRHLGFDTYEYPGDDVMRAWRAEAPYEWVGYYLPAPCHSGTSWSGTRQRLAGMGWGMAVIYVGQQTWDKTPRGYEISYRTARRTKYVTKRMKTYVVRSGRRVARYVTKRVPVKRTVRIPVKVHVDPRERPIDDCNAQLVNATRGRMEARDAIKRTAAEGFPPGAVIFLDIEYMRATPSRMRDYYRAWTAAVLQDGRYRPGFYAHTRNAALIYADVKREYARFGMTDEPPFWISGEADSFDQDATPDRVGHAFASVWQGVLDVVQEWNGYKLPIDVNVSHASDPSHEFLSTN
jgi:hypothetical protein